MTKEKTEDNLLQLIRLGLSIDNTHIEFVNAKPLSFTTDEWAEIASLAKEQAVAEMLIPSIEQLPNESCPPQSLLRHMIAQAEAIRRRNVKVYNIIVELVKELRIAGIEPIVVKGQVVAREYFTSGIRISDDIDILIAPQHWSYVEKWIADCGFDVSRIAAEKHVELSYKGVAVELHYHLNTFSTAKVNRYWTENIEKKAVEDSRIVEINGYPVNTLGITETLLHLMVHIHHHLLTEGVGLRQLIDFTLFLRNHFNELDLSKLREHLYGIKHDKAFNAFCALANKYLGLKPQFIPFELDLRDYVYADKIMDQVWRGGNFGHKKNLSGVKPGLLHSANTALLLLKHSWKFYRLAPEEARGYWLNKIFWRWQRETRAKLPQNTK